VGQYWWGSGRAWRSHVSSAQQHGQRHQGIKLCQSSRGSVMTLHALRPFVDEVMPAF
jgi:hypothetical protein